MSPTRLVRKALSAASLFFFLPPVPDESEGADADQLPTDEHLQGVRTQHVEEHRSGEERQEGVVVREALVAVEVLGGVDVHQQRDDADGDEHHRRQSVEQGARLEVDRADLEPGDRAHDGRDGLVLALAGGCALGGGGALARGRRGLRARGDGLAGVLGGGVGLRADLGRGLRGEAVGLADVLGQRDAGGRVVHPIDPLPGDDDGEEEADRHRGDADAGGGLGTGLLAEEEDQQERRRHDGGDDPDLVEEVGDHVRRQPFRRSTSSASMLWRLR
jgi:hypothetical protein